MGFGIGPGKPIIGKNDTRHLPYAHWDRPGNSQLIDKGKSELNVCQDLPVSPELKILVASQGCRNFCKKQPFNINSSGQVILNNA